MSALALFGLGGYLVWDYATISDHFELSPDNGWFMLLLPAPVDPGRPASAAWAKWVRRAPYFRTGQGTTPTITRRWTRAVTELSADPERPRHPPT